MLPKNWERLKIDTLTPSDASAIKLINTLKCNRDVKITTSEYKELLEKIPLENLPPLPNDIPSRILAISY